VFAKKSEKKKKVVEDTKVVAKLPALVVNETVYPYGKFGMVNFTYSKDSTHNDNDILRYRSLPPEGKLTPELVLQVQRANMFEIYKSNWRLMFQKDAKHPAMQIKTDVSEYDSHKRSVEAIYLHNYLVGFREHDMMWVKNWDKLAPHMAYDLDRASRNFRGCRTVLALSRDMMFKEEYVPLLLSMWKWFSIPLLDNYMTNFRFYVFSSSIPGEKASDKLRFISALPEQFLKMLCVIADDINMKQLAIIVKRTNIRGTFVPTEVKEDGKMITGKTQSYVEMLAVHQQLGGGYSPAPVFIPEKDLNDKILKYYTRMTNVILF
jgi:hypothetical protein